MDNPWTFKKLQMVIFLNKVCTLRISPFLRQSRRFWDFLWTSFGRSLAYMSEFLGVDNRKKRILILRTKQRWKFAKKYSNVR